MVPHVIISGSSPIVDMLGDGVEETKLNPATLGVSVTFLPFIYGAGSNLAAAVWLTINKSCP